MLRIIFRKTDPLIDVDPPVQPCRNRFEENNIINAHPNIRGLILDNGGPRHSRLFFLVL